MRAWWLLSIHPLFLSMAVNAANNVLAPLDVAMGEELLFYKSRVAATWSFNLVESLLKVYSVINLPPYCGFK